MKEKKCFNIAMIGAGYGAFLHGNAYSHAGGVDFRLHTVCDVDIEKAEKIKEQYGYVAATDSFEAVLENEEIDVIDIVTPPFLHAEMVRRAMEAGKNVICEKPLTGYFGNPGDETPIGKKVSKARMYEDVIRQLDGLRETVRNGKGHFYYAENFVHAPAVQKTAEIICLKQSKILSMRAVIAMKGSSSPLAGDWASTGGGCWARNGVHPLGAVLWLKQQEAKARGEEIRPVSVLADMGTLTDILTEEEHRYISAQPIDVEDHAVVTITFSDGTKATIYAADTCLGGGRNYVDVYCNDAAMECKLTDTDVMHTYLLDEKGLEGYYLAEMLPSMTGWNKAFVADDTLRGHAQEMQDFLKALVEDKDAESDFELGYQVIKILYAAYVSAEEGRRIML